MTTRKYMGHQESEHLHVQDQKLYILQCPSQKSSDVGKIRITSHLLISSQNRIPHLCLQHI